MKKIFTVIALLMMATWVGWGQETFSGGTGTEDDPYKISSAEDLKALASSTENQYTGKYFILTQDIDLNPGITFSEEEPYVSGTPEEWTPCSVYSFDGNNHTISGVYVKYDNTEPEKEGIAKKSVIGLFSEGSIKNLNVANSYIEVNSDIDASIRMYIGGVVGSRVPSNCSFDGVINANIKGNIDYLYIGGIYGTGISASGYDTKYCHTAGRINVSLKDIQFKGTGACSIAGIGMYASSYSYNTADITVDINKMTSGTSEIFGATISVGTLMISGVSNDSNNRNSCYNTGNITVNGADIDTKMPFIEIGGILNITGDKTCMSYCYNTGIITTSGFEDFTNVVEGNSFYGAGSMIGIDQSRQGAKPTFTKNYYVNGTNAIGCFARKESTTYEGLIAATKTQFESGEIAYALRDEGGYGQNLDEYGKAIDETPVLLCFAGDKQKVYKLTLKSNDITDIKGDIYRNAEPAKLLQEDVYNKLMETADEGKDLIWKNKEGNVVAIGNDYTPSTDEKLTAEWGDVYTITTEVEPTAEAGIVEVSKKKAQEGDEISFTVTANEGYEFVSVTGATFTHGEEAGSYTFTLPAKDVTITATFEKIETGGDDDDEGGISTKRYQLFLADRDFYLNDKYDAEGLVLFSRHDKRYAEVGGSFTVYYEKDGEVNAGDYRIFWSKSANGEYKEVKLDEVSGYYQIRNVQSNIYVKLYTEEGFPVANEAIEATETRAYAQANKIVVVTPEPTEVQIISMAGAVVATAQVAGQQEFANLAEGVYIVRMGKSVVKLQVRN